MVEVGLKTSIYRTVGELIFLISIWYLYSRASIATDMQSSAADTAAELLPEDMSAEFMLFLAITGNYHGDKSTAVLVW